MEEDQGRASPPLPGSRGSYNIDFDALDDSFNPFQTQRHIRNSPPLETKEHNNSTEGEAVAQESHQPASDSRVQESSNSLKETSETPKKRKSKSPSSKQAAVERDAESLVADSCQTVGDGPEDAAAVAVTEKPVK